MEGTSPVPEVRLKRLIVLSSALVLCSGAFVSRSHASQAGTNWNVDSILNMMDKSAKDFHSLTADIEHIKYTAVVKDTSKEKGHIYVRHDGKMRIEMTDPDVRTILRTGDSLFVFTPKINRVEEYDLGKNRSLVDQYVRLGFGTRAEDLKKSYLITFLGEEELDQKKVLALELTPKSDQVRAQITKIHIWVDEASWLPIQQKFFEPGSGDYVSFHYLGMKKNLKLPESRFKQDWPKSVNHVKPRA